MLVGSLQSQIDSLQSQVQLLLEKYDSMETRTTFAETNIQTIQDKINLQPVQARSHSSLKQQRSTSQLKQQQRLSAAQNSSANRDSVMKNHDAIGDRMDSI